MQIKRVRLEAEGADIGLETAKLLFAHLDPSAPVAQAPDRAREIYDRLRCMATQDEASISIARARADTLAAPFKPGESGVSPRIR